ncbi:MAG: aminoglycoside phosphotransferase family protein, partial [Lachnospiraceae bacterium]|nr:aminoglycoside phosphotransferase family protein [Lachnospiraceae bacterium]
KEVMREYLAAFSEVKYQIVEANGTGTCSGIGQALDLIPQNKSFLLIWSDLILPKNFQLPDEYQGLEKAKHDYVGISSTFPCRWSYKDGSFTEESSVEHGVAGFFLFKDKSKLEHVPASGELVRWMQARQMPFCEISLAGTGEFGILQEYEKLEKEKCRPFNRITVDGDVFIKEAVDKQGEKLAARECAWYEKAKKNKIRVLPHIYETSPLKMEYIKGKNIYECQFSYEEKRKILDQLIRALHELHGSDSVPADSFSMKEAYFNKTMARLSKIEDLVPFGRDKVIRINGKDCRNIYFYKRDLEKKIERLVCEKFSFIHGDCTFSNMMLREDGTPVLIDPRGYFGFTEMFGDVRYDWAKLYYSIVGNYDRFNLKDFRLEIGEKEISLQIQSNQWEDMEEAFFTLTGADPEEIKLLHAVIWLSLTTYAWQDYDSICGAFYNGLYYLEDML